MKRRFTIIIMFLFLLLTSTNLFSQGHKGSFGIRAGLGTDINLGLGYGGGVSYLFPNSTVELSIVLFGHHSEETTEEFNTYNEITDIFVYGVMGNYLIGYSYKKPGAYGIVGFGFSAVSVDWEESSPNDVSLGTPIPSGGSKQSASGTGGGSVINAGFGYSFGQANLRAEFPVIISFSSTGDASTVIPTLIITLGYNFLSLLV